MRTMNIKERLKKLELFADIMSRIFHYGNMEIETSNERTACGILNDLGYFPTTEQHILNRADYEECRVQYKNYRLPEEQE